jgi:hypothetical protein
MPVPCAGCPWPTPRARWPDTGGRRVVLALRSLEPDPVVGRYRFLRGPQARAQGKSTIRAEMSARAPNPSPRQAAPSKGASRQSGPSRRGPTGRCRGSPDPGEPRLVFAPETESSGPVAPNDTTRVPWAIWPSACDACEPGMRAATRVAHFRAALGVCNESMAWSFWGPLRPHHCDCER